MTAKEIQRRIERIVDNGNKTYSDSLSPKSISKAGEIVLSYIKMPFMGYNALTSVMFYYAAKP